MFSVLPFNVMGQWQWPEATLESVDLNSKPIQKVHRLLKRGKDYKQVDSFLIVKDDKLVFEKYYNSGRKSKPHTMASAGKVMLSALVGISIHKQQIKSVEDKIHPYFSDVYSSFQHWDETKASITIHDLLSMRAGWDCNLLDKNRRCSQDMFKGRDAYEGIKWVLDRPMRYQPGRFMQYSDVIPPVMSTIVHIAALNKSPTSIQSALLEPIGINVKSASKMTSRQMARLGRLYLHQGRWLGKQVVPQEWVEKSTSALYPLSEKFNGHAHSYGYMWWIARFKSKRNNLQVESYYAAGNGGQYIVVLPAINMIVVMTGSNFNDFKAMAKTLSIIEEFVLAAFDT